MDANGHLYHPPGNRPETASPTDNTVHQATDEELARVRAKLGGVVITDGEARLLAAMPRKRRRKALALIRSGELVSDIEK